MTELLHNWIMGLTAACLISSFALSVNRKGAVSRVTRLVCGIVLAAVLFAPLTELDMDSYSVSLSHYRNRAAELAGELEDVRQRLNRTYIEEQCAAYILDEAQALGAEGRAEVRVRWRDDCWVPWEAEVTLSGASDVKEKLAERVEADLGIPRERQRWNEGG